MPIKVRLPKHARSLSHSYYYCLIGEGCEGRESFQQWLLTLISDPLLTVFTVGNWGGSKLWHRGWQRHVTLGLFRSNFQTHGMSLLKMVPPFPALVHPLAYLPSLSTSSTPVLQLHYNWQARCYFVLFCFKAMY